MAKSISSFPAWELATVTASRKEQSALHVPSFVSAVFVTVYVAARTDEIGILRNERIQISRRSTVIVILIEYFIPRNKMHPECIQLEYTPEL
jgi:hypothetical protein